MKKYLAIIGMLVIGLSFIGAANAIDTGQLSVNGGAPVSGVFQGKSTNGAIHYYVTGYDPISSAVLQINGKTVTWNGKNGAEYASIPYGYNGAIWHFIYTPSGVLTISGVTGICPCCPCC